MSVYKYLPSDSLKYIFEENTLRFSSPLDFNDPFELKPNIKNIIDEENHMVVSMFSSYLNNSGQAHKFHEVIVNDLSKNIGILCLSGTHDNLVMWGHYANNHQGIVIEFHKEHDFFSINTELEFLHELKEVIYINKRLSMNSDEWGKDERTFLAKSKYWEYEDEYRMTILLDEFDNNPNKYNIKFPPEIIKSIYIGCKTSTNDIKYIKNLKNQEKWRHLKISQFKIDEKEYKLVPEELIIEDITPYLGTDNVR